MANVLDTLDTDRVHYYDPKQDKTAKLIEKTLYLGHVKTCTVREVAVKGKYRAKVFNYSVELAKENDKETFHTSNGTAVDGGAFVGREVWGTGVFFFLNPSEGDDFEANNGGNEVYLKFCEGLGIECPTTEIEVDGETRSVLTLPDLEPTDAIGKPVKAYVDYAKVRDKDGSYNPRLRVKSVVAWTDGEVKEVDVDLPF